MRSILVQNLAKGINMTFVNTKIENSKPGFKVHARGKIYDSILDTIGATPLVRLSRFKQYHGLQVDVLAKLEYFNPMASVKDRVGLAMIEAAEHAGKIKAGKTTIVEPTSGNTGIALAFVCAYKGYRLILTMPESMSEERQKMLQYMGAQLILTPAEKGMKGAIQEAEKILREDKSAFCPAQFDNAANPQIHSETTAEEILIDSQGKIDILISGIGTGGSFSGIAKTLKERLPHLKAIAVEPEESAVISGEEAGEHGIQGIGAGFIPKVLDTELVDGTLNVSTEAALEMARHVATLESLACGISSGAALEAAKRVGKRPENAGKTIVAIIPSFAERYLSSKLFDGVDM